MFETMFAYIKECERKIGNNARVGISIHTNQVVLMVRWGNDKEPLHYRYQFHMDEILETSQDRFPFDLFTVKAKEEYNRAHFLKGENYNG